MGSEFVDPRVGRILGGVDEPDFVEIKDGKIRVIVEVKGKWSVSHNPDIPLATQSNTHETSAIHQLYTYLVTNKRRFGILTTYDYTWFFTRVVGEVLIIRP